MKANVVFVRQRHRRAELHKGHHKFKVVARQRRMDLSRADDISGDHVSHGGVRVKVLSRPVTLYAAVVATLLLVGVGILR